MHSVSDPLGSNVSRRLTAMKSVPSVGSERVRVCVCACVRVCVCVCVCMCVCER